MSGSNYIERVALVGAGGRGGKFIAEALLKAGKQVTAITRHDGGNTLPEGVTPVPVDYARRETLVDALRGHDALVVTLAHTAPPEVQKALFEAAAEAGVAWILPNEWSADLEDKGLVRDVPILQSKAPTREYIKTLGKSSYIAVETGFWYEWSVALTPGYGFDFENKKVTFYDNGETKISTSTWPQIGRAVAGILSLPVRAEGDSKGSLESLANKVVYVNSFTLSQRDIFASVLRVTGAKESDWTISKEPVQERFAAGAAAGTQLGFIQMLYARVFYSDGNGDFETSRGTLNALLDLPDEDLDAATARGIERSKAPFA